MLGAEEMGTEVEEDGGVAAAGEEEEEGVAAAALEGEGELEEEEGAGEEEEAAVGGQRSLPLATATPAPAPAPAPDSAPTPVPLLPAAPTGGLATPDTEPAAAAVMGLAAATELGALFFFTALPFGPTSVHSCSAGPLLPVPSCVMPCIRARCL